MDRNWTQGLSHGAVLKRTNGTKVLEQGSEEAKQLSSSIVQRSIVEMYFFESDIDKIDGEAEINFRIRRKKKSRWREQLKPTSLSLLVVVLPLGNRSKSSSFATAQGCNQNRRRGGEE